MITCAGQRKVANSCIAMGDKLPDFNVAPPESSDRFLLTMLDIAAGYELLAEGAGRRNKSKPKES